MADVIVSVVANRLADMVAEQIGKRVNLIKGVEKEILNLSDELKAIRNVLDDAERRGSKEQSIKVWLKRLEDASYEIDDVLDEWNMRILKLQLEHSNDGVHVHPPKYKVHSFIPLFFRKVAIRRSISKKIANAKARLNLVLAEKDRYDFVVTSQPTNSPTRESWRVQSTSLIDLEQVFGREFERENLVRKLVPQEELGLRVLSIVGVGGLGKTTLAKLAYNDKLVEEYFELRIWICVSDFFDVVGIAKGIIERAGGSLPNTNQLDMLLQCLRASIFGKKFLLVLDDVWTEDETKWEPLKNSLKCCGPGSKILVTTRNERVGIMMGAVKNEIPHLSNEECWLVLGRVALVGKNNEECEKFQNIGRDIANKCKGLPLAAKTLGSLLRFKHTLEEWENVLNSEIWELEKVEIELFPHLLLSYNELSPTLKRCFSYCAAFPKDSRIEVESLITKWMALGYLESNCSSSTVGDWQLRGREYFDKLAMRSLFQDFEKASSDLDADEQIKSFKMHDILHDFAQFLRTNGGTEATKKTTCQTCSPLLVSHVKEYRSLFCYEQPPSHLCDCLASLRLLSLRGCGLQSIPKEIERLIHLRWLDLGCNQFSKENDLQTICELYNLQFLWVDLCELEEIPQEIGNLLCLKHLDLSGNKLVEELPESLCSLHELESLNVDSCESLRALPQKIHMLTNLKHLSNRYTCLLKQYPRGLAQLTSIRTLSQFYGGCERSNLGWLKNLNRLSWSLDLMIQLSGGSEEVVEDAREAELKKKIQIQKLSIDFSGSTGEVKGAVWIDVIDALEPHPGLQHLGISDYLAYRLPGWIVSPANQLRSIKLINCKYLLSLLPLGKLPFLENIEMYGINELKFVGREFLGIMPRGDRLGKKASSSSSSNVIGFPKLKKLTFDYCPKWKEWEDITVEEEHSVLVMPCLKTLSIKNCSHLKELPYHLLRKATLLKVLNVYGSEELKTRYRDMEGEAWKSISRHNPNLRLKGLMDFGPRYHYW